MRKCLGGLKQSSRSSRKKRMPRTSFKVRLRPRTFCASCVTNSVIKLDKHVNSFSTDVSMINNFCGILILTRIDFISRSHHSSTMNEKTGKKNASDRTTKKSSLGQTNANVLGFRRASIEASATSSRTTFTGPNHAESKESNRYTSTVYKLLVCWNLHLATRDLFSSPDGPMGSRPKTS